MSQIENRFLNLKKSIHGKKILTLDPSKSDTEKILN